MKIISLNTWGGIAGADGLIVFFKDHQYVDVFCLQEVFNGGEGDSAEKQEKIESKVYNLLSLLEEALPNHHCYFRPHLKEYYGLLMCVKKDIELLEEGEHFVHKEKGYVPEGISTGHHARNIQYVKLNRNGNNLYIINFHGLWNGKGKTDTDDRIQQSKKIIEFTNSISDNFVLIGDFNLRPDTRSLKLFEEAGMRNLIKEYAITSTRTSHYTKDEKFADYAFVSEGIPVKDFKVLSDEVSDHAPLYLEI
jgi:endonuclease/exonuclease/phosphatase family metal-dependent hydrolase